MLRQDPSGVYPHMDFTTRDRCRRAIEELHRGSGLAEDHIARRALDLASRLAQSTAADDHAGTVATYLIGDRRGDLARVIGCHETRVYRLLQWIYRHHAVVYCAALSFFTMLAVAVPVLLGLQDEATGTQLLLTFLLLIPGSQLALEAVNFLVMRLLPPRILPKMDYKVSGVPDSCRTLVVVPVILMDTEAVREEVEKLEIRYLANKENNLLFALFTDFAGRSGSA